jgi:MFS family permease
VNDGSQTAAPHSRRTLWRHADFMKLWTAETISQLGTQVTLLALPLTAILILKASAFEVGLLSALEFLPFILVGLPAGVWVDRLRRRPILIVGDLGRALTLGSIPLVYELHHLTIWQLYAVAFLTGVLTVFFDVSYQSYLPSLVERDQLVEGNSKLEISRSGAQLAGPGLGGLLVQALRAPVAIFADALSYLWSAMWVFLIRKPEARIERPVEGHRSMRSEIKEGLRYVWRHPYLRPIAFCTGTANLFGSMLFALMVLFAVRVLHLRPGLIGLALAIGNVGFLLGAFSAQRIADRVGVGRAIVWSIGLTSPVWILFPLATPSTGFAILVITGFITSFGGMAVYNINQVSLRQAITPHRMQGRMNATMRFMVWGTMPIGAFVGGILGNTIGLRPTLWVSAIGGMFAFLPPLFSPVRSLQRIPEYTEEEVLPASGDGVLEPGHLPPRVVEPPVEEEARTT